MTKSTLLLVMLAIAILGFGGICGALIAHTTGISVSVAKADSNVYEKNDPLVLMYYLLKKTATNLTYCDGATMKSAEYKNALTRTIFESVPGTFTLEEKIKATLTVAADAQLFNKQYTLVSNTTYNKGVVTMHSADGWAGSSIFYCAWKPFVEKNLEQFSEVKTIVWADAL